MRRWKLIFQIENNNVHLKLKGIKDSTGKPRNHKCIDVRINKFIGSSENGVKLNIKTKHILGTSNYF